MVLAQHLQAAVASGHRPDTDKKRDEGRKPAEVLAFFEIEPGQKVAELNAGRGYFSALLAEAVGPDGQVYAHSTEASVKRWKGNPLQERIDECGYTQMECRITEKMEEPNLAPGLDAVFMIMNYHDAVWTGADRPKLLKAIWESLRPGGIFGIIDHHAAEGMGLSDCDKNHRIEKCVCVDEVAAAGFELEAESDILENSDDPMDCGVHGPKIRDHTHRFVLKFRRPA